jgi:hypothetical protein
MAGNEEIKQQILDWFERNSREGSKTRFYLKDVVKAFPQNAKQDIQHGVNACIEDGTLMWFSTGSTNLLVLPKYHKG